MRRRDGLLFGLFAVVCVALMVGYVALVALRAEPSVSDTGGATRTLATPGALLFRSTDQSRPDKVGEVSITTAAAPGTNTRRAGLRCDRVYFAAGRGLCLDSAGAATYVARILDKRMRPAATIRLQGIPSRARVSPDGRYGSVTSFVAGHSYAQGTFSTQTLLIDLAGAKVIGDLERFDIRSTSGSLDAPDLNLWGTTFTADSDRFYATAASGGSTHLVLGSVSSRSAQVLHDNVECPSLSPSGTRIAYKKRVGSSRGSWRLTVLDLGSMRETALAETRSVDDQVEWLDDERIMYGVDGHVWIARADGSGAAERYLPNAESPVVIRR